jgi:hypothetical protein
MPARLPLPLQTVYAELVDRCAVDALDTAFPPGGSFVRRKVKDRFYWYFVLGRADEGGRREQRYVGPDSPELQERIARHGQAKSAWRERRQMVVALLRAGLPAPDDRTGELLGALAEAGLFRLRACLIGTVAFQCYAGLLGTKLPGAIVRTGDLDLAQFHAISVAIAEDEHTPPMLEILRGVDPSFREVPYALDGRLTAAYAGEGGYRVEILVPNRGPDRDEPQALPAIGAMAVPLRFLDFLIYDAVPAVLLHEAGVLVNVPRPERYALHKLIVSRRRREGATKIDKDLAQAAILLPILAERRKADLRDAWEELQARGPKWRRLAGEGLESLPAEVQERVRNLLAPTRG